MFLALGFSEKLKSTNPKGSKNLKTNKEHPKVFLKYDYFEA